MISAKAVITDSTGLHLRPAGIFCKIAMQYKSNTTFKIRNITANGKSILSILAACVKCGDEIEIICDGEDEQEALKALTTAAYVGFMEYDSVKNKSDDLFFTGYL